MSGRIGSGHIRDRWMVNNPVGKKVKGPLWGRGRRWQARWVEAGYERSATFASKEQAQHHLARIQVGEIATPTPSPTVAEFVPVWLSLQVHYAPASLRAARERLGKHVVAEIGHRSLNSITRDEIQRLVSTWSETLAPATVAQTYSFVASVFSTAHEDGLIRHTPCVRINLPTVRKPRVVPLTVDQVQTVAERVNPRYRSMVVVGAATGMRGAELRGLTVDRLLGDDVQIDRQLAGTKWGRPVWADTKSVAGERRIGLGATARTAIDQHLEQWGEGIDGLIWVTRQGGPVNRSRSQEIWTHAIDGLGFRDRSGWHDLRHHHASLLIRAGLSVTAVAARLGHADPAETLRVYSHLWPDDDERATAAVDSALIGLLY